MKKIASRLCSGVTESGLHFDLSRVPRSSTSGLATDDRVEDNEEDKKYA